MSKKEHIFTFGHGQKHAGKFVSIFSDSDSEARREMHRLFGDKWAFHYTDTEKITAREKAGVGRWGLTEIHIQPLPDEIFMKSPGDTCINNGCDGHYYSQPDGDCSCHIKSPCAACENAYLVCNTCGEFLVETNLG